MGKTLDGRLAKLEAVTPGADYCECPFDYAESIACLSADLVGPHTETHCRRCGKPLSIAVRVVDLTEGPYLPERDYEGVTP